MKKELTLNDFIGMLMAHIKLTVVLSVLVAFLAFAYTEFFVIPMYSSTAMVYVKNSNEVVVPYSDSDSDSTSKINVQDITASAKILDTCKVIFKTTEFMNIIVKDLGLSYSPGALKGMITLTSDGSTQILTITVKGSDPNDCANIANSFSKNAEAYFRKFFSAGQVIPLESANPSSTPYSPNVNSNVVFGFAIGLIAGMLISLFIEFIDTTVKADDDLYKMYDVPVFAEIIDFETDVGNKYGYSYGNYSYYSYGYGYGNGGKK